MPVILAYILVVIIWSTTPLAIQWSNTSLTFLAAATLRMLLALGVCLLVLLAMRRPLVKQGSDWKVFAVGCIGIFPNMLLVYWSAQYIPSGVMAVVLGIYPFFVGVFSLLFLKENVFNVTRVLALLIAVGGLMLIHSEQMVFGDKAIQGVLGMLLSAVFFAMSSVWMKAVGGAVDPLRQSTGVLLLAAPCFLVTWLLFDGVIPSAVEMKSISGLVYLVLAGSVVGHTLFFYVLRHCTVGTVALITLITPVIALVIGFYIADEVITLKGGMGAALIVFSLAIYQGVWRQLVRGVRAGFRLSRRAGKREQPGAIQESA